MHHHQDDDLEIVAHMSPAELKYLDSLQGGRQIDPHTKLPTYRLLGELLNQGDVKSMVDDWERKKFAGGGEVEGINEHLRRMGRYGDTEVAKLPRPLADLFDRALNEGRPSINPHTGKREYFLGGLLSGIGNIFSKGLSGIKSFLPGLGQAGLSTLGSIAKQGFNDFTSGNFNPADFAKGAFNTAVQNFSPVAGQMAQQGLTALGAEAGNPELGEMAGNFANNFISQMAPQASQAFATGQEMPNFAQGAAQHMGNAIQNSPYSQNPYAAGMGQALQGYAGGMNPQDALYRGMTYAGNNTQNPLIGAGLNAGANAFQNYRGGQSPFSAALSGLRSISPEQRSGAMNQAMNYGRQGYKAFTDRFAPSYSQNPQQQVG